MPQLVQGIELVGIDEPQRLAQGFGYFFGGSICVGRHIDGADHHLLAPDEFDQIHGNVRVVTFQ
jgi:hypothetical protein